MKKIIIILLIYFIGCLISYQILKAQEIIFNERLRKQYHNEKIATWSNNDRLMCATLSIFSWAGVAAGGILYWIEINDFASKGDNEASW